MKNALKYVGLIAAQGAVAFALAVFLIGPALRGEPMPWQKSADGAEHVEGEDEHAEADGAEADGEHGEKSSKKEKPKKKGHGDEVGGLLPIEAVIVNVAETQGRRFLKASLTLEVDGTEVEAATARLPVFRGTVMDVLAAKNLEELVSPNSRSQIRGEILEALNSKDESLEFKDLFFTEFIVQ